MSKPNSTRDIEFLFEMGNIRFIERMWRRFLHDDFANLAEHHFRMFWIAQVIAAYEPDADSGKVAKLCLVHDIAESRAGDVDYVARQYVDRNEEMAITDMLTGTALSKEYGALWQDYEAHSSLEARIAKDADNLDVDFELMEQAAKGSQLKSKWQENRGFVAREKLHTNTARQMYDELLAADPHAWHLHARNRISSGDWKH